MSMVAGADGCKAGWMAVVAPVGDLTAARAMICQDFAQLLRSPDRPRIVAVDMPIGLAEHNGPGRAAEIQLRPHLGRRRSSIFPIPSRAAVYAPDYDLARKLALQTSEPPRSVSKQAFYIFPKIRELDALVRAQPDLAAKIHECHPEGAFRMMRAAPLDFAKRHPAGVEERRALLLAAGFNAALLDQAPPRGAARDDLFDACAALWTATRIASGAARCWPPEPPRDAYGLRMAIWT